MAAFIAICIWLVALDDSNVRRFATTSPTLIFFYHENDGLLHADAGKTMKFDLYAPRQNVHIEETGWGDETWVTREVLGPPRQLHPSERIHLVLTRAKNTIIDSLIACIEIGIGASYLFGAIAFLMSVFTPSPKSDDTQGCSSS
jgi:hypothetical protein